MRILVPYNEILPKRAAHDVFVFHECVALAEAGHQVTLLCGKGSQSDEELFSHYNCKKNNLLKIKRLPIVRKNNPLNLSWNLPFFRACQKEIRRERPDFVFLSVMKQGAYHVKRRLPNVRYLYEIHQLAHYPGSSGETKEERKLFSQCDLLAPSTHALKDILQAPPYQLSVPIKVIPLSVNAHPLPPPTTETPFTLFYVGQLYEKQGVAFLLQALAKVPEIHLKVVGGKNEEISRLKELSEALNLDDRVEFLGFCPPSQLPEVVKEAHAFVAPFDDSERMPYVAHTKLFEYAEWGRPFIAPRLPAVKEHFCEKNGAILYKANSIRSLQLALRKLVKEHAELQKRVGTLSGAFCWKKRARMLSLVEK